MADSDAIQLVVKILSDVKGADNAITSLKNTEEGFKSLEIWAKRVRKEYDITFQDLAEGLKNYNKAVKGTELPKINPGLIKKFSESLSVPPAKISPVKAQIVDIDALEAKLVELNLKKDKLDQQFSKNKMKFDDYSKVLIPLQEELKLVEDQIVAYKNKKKAVVEAQAPKAVPPATRYTNPEVNVERAERQAANNQQQVRASQISQSNRNKYQSLWNDIQLKLRQTINDQIVSEEKLITAFSGDSRALLDKLGHGTRVRQEITDKLLAWTRTNPNASLAEAEEQLNKILIERNKLVEDALNPLKIESGLQPTSTPAPKPRKPRVSPLRPKEQLPETITLTPEQAAQAAAIQAQLNAKQSEGNKQVVSEQLNGVKQVEQAQISSNNIVHSEKEKQLTIETKQELANIRTKTQKEIDDERQHHEQELANIKQKALVNSTERKYQDAKRTAELQQSSLSASVTTKVGAIREKSRIRVQTEADLADIEAFKKADIEATKTAEQAKRQAQLETHKQHLAQIKVETDAEIQAGRTAAKEANRTNADEHKQQIHRIEDVSKAWDAAYAERSDREKQALNVTMKGRTLNAFEANKMQIGAALAGATTPQEQVKVLTPLIKKLSAETRTSSDEMIRLVKATYGLDDATVKKLTTSVHNAKNGITGMIKEMFDLKAILNTAFGVGMAMLMFNLTQGIQQFFTDSLQKAKDFANAMANLRVGEQILSQEGFKITGKEIMKVLDDLDKKLKFISRTDITKGLGSALNQLSTRGITAGQAGKIVEIAAIVKLKSPDRDVNEIVANITNGILTGTSEATKNIGLQFDDLRVKQKAKELGLISDMTKKLTEQEKVQARIALAVDYANQKLGASIDQADEQTMMLAQQDKLWSSIQLKLGQLILPILVNSKDATKGLLGYLNEALETAKQLAVIIEYTWSAGQKRAEAAGGWVKGLSVVALTGKQIKLNPEEEAKLWKTAMDKYFPSVGDTPTGIPPLTSENADLTEENQKKIQSSINSLINALDQLGDRARNAEEDYRNAIEKETESFNVEQARAAEDAAIERQRMIDDANKSIAEKEKQAHDDRLEKEAKFQEQLRQLREKYLLSLEDALHERDARQVLRLAREYAMNKQNMINEHALEMSKTGSQADVAKIKNDLADRLRIFDEETALKAKRANQDFKLKMKRMEQEHIIEMRRLEHEKQDKLHQMAQEMADTFGLNKEGMDRLYKLFDSYFGENGGIGSLVKYQYENITRYTEAMLKDLSILLQQYQITTTAIGNTLVTTPPNTHVYPGQTTSNLTPTTTTSTTTRLPVGTNNVRRASGGLDLVNKPTSVLMGESGPEAHLFVPLNKLSSLSGGINNLSSMNLNQNNNSKVELLVDLSPDLETRVVKKSMDELANVVMQVRKARA